MELHTQARMSNPALFVPGALQALLVDIDQGECGAAARQDPRRRAANARCRAGKVDAAASKSVSVCQGP